MDNFIFKFKSIFDYNGDINIFQIFKEETLQFLNDKNLRIVDYKSIGSLFGMNYNQDNVKNVDVLIELNYDFYIIKKFVNELVCFYSGRGNLTKKTYEEIIESYALDNHDLIKSINKTNERKKFKLLQKRIWMPLYNAIKTYKNKDENKNKNQLKDNYDDNYDNDNDNDNDNDDDNYENKNHEETTPTPIISHNNYELNICKVKDDNKYKKAVEDMDENWFSISGKKKKLKVNLMEYYGAKENIETKETKEVKENIETKDIYIKNRFSKLVEDEDVEDDYDPEDRKKFGKYKIYDKYDLQEIKLCEEQYEKLIKSEHNVEKIIINIENEIGYKKKINWADITDEDEAEDEAKDESER
jgi:hypothetical protein